MKKIIFAILIILVVYLTLILRVVEVLNKNYLFGFDQGRDYLAVKSIVVDRKPTLIGSEIGAGSAGFQGIFHGPFYYYSLVIPFLIFRGDPYGGILLMFLFGILSVILGYFLGNKLFGKMGGLISALLVAISPPLISQSRFVWNSHPSTFFILLSFFFLYLFLKERKEKYIFFAAFFSGFIYNFELAIAIPLSLSLIIFTIFILRFNSFKTYFVMLSGLIIAYSPMFLFETRHDFIGLRGLINYLLYNEKTPMTFKFLQLITKEHFDSFWFNFLVTFPKQNLIPAIGIILAMLISTILFLLKEKNTALKKFIYFLILLIPVNFLVFSFLKNAVYTYYLIDLNLAYIFILSYIVFSAYKNHGYFIKGLLTTFLFVLIIYALKDYTPNAKADYFDYGGDAKIKGRIEAIDYIYKNAKGEKFGLFVFSPPVYTYPYDYLIWWYGRQKYNYVPHQEKKGIFYLLIEVDASKPLTYKGWMETVIKTGRVIETKTLPSGFIVQKRSNDKN